MPQGISADCHRTLPALVFSRLNLDTPYLCFPESLPHLSKGNMPLAQASPVLFFFFFFAMHNVEAPLYSCAPLFDFEGSACV